MESPQPPVEQVSRLADIILYLQRCFMLRLSEELSDGKISFAQFFLLSHLAECDSPNMSEIAARMNHSTAAATGLVDRLESLGYAKRHHSTDDRRKVTVQITPKGSALCARVREGIIQNLSEIMGTLSRREREMWLQIYEKIFCLCQATHRETQKK